MSAAWDELREIARALPQPVAARLAGEWARDGQFEHASIASFGRFAFELLAVAAPSELVESALRAAIDEIEHARLCFSLASVYGADPIGPGALALDPAAFTPPDLAAMTRATVLEGCVNETLAALEAAAARTQAQPRAVCDALQVIEKQEADHAGLAFRFVSWAIATGGDAVLDAAHAAFTLGLAQLAPPSAATQLDEPSLEQLLVRHGRLPDRRRRELRQRAALEVIRPAARNLLGREP